MRRMSQLARAVGRRLIRRSDVVIVRSRNPHAQPPKLVGLTVVRSNQLLGVDQSLVETSMRKAGELGVDMQARFCCGDEYIALRGSEGIVAFTWVTYADRTEGSVCVHAAPERAIIYNSVTLPEFRGRGLCSMLIQQLQSLLVAEGRTDFVAGIPPLDASSLRAFDKSKFMHVAVARELVLFNRVKIALPPLVQDPRARVLFAAHAAPDSSMEQGARKLQAS